MTTTETETTVVGDTQPTEGAIEAAAVFLAAAALVPLLEENELEALHLTRAATDEGETRQEASTGEACDLGTLVARLEAVEAALAGLSGPSGVLITGQVAVVAGDGHPVVLLGGRSRPVEVLSQGEPAAWIEATSGWTGLHLRHRGATIGLTARDGSSQGNTAMNGARLKLADGAAAAAVSAQQSRLVTDAGSSMSGRAGLRLSGAREGDPGAMFNVDAAAEWVEANFVSRADDDDRAARVDVHVEHETIEKTGLESGEAYVSDYVPDPPAWSHRPTSACSSG